MSSSEVACTYAALILHDDGIPITVRARRSLSSFFVRFIGGGMTFAPSESQADKIATIVKAANVNVESYWPGLFAKLLDTRSVDDLILSVGSGIHIVPTRIALSCSCVNWFHIFVGA
jgi:hypothetical protein